MNGTGGTTTKTIQVNALTRVEGMASVTLVLDGAEVIEAKLRIIEAPRLFEAFLRGRHCTETPDITSRICGICPVAYQMSACHAIEDAFGIRVDGALRDLRRLLYCGEWIESHVLHILMLHAPDFFGVPDFLALAKLHPERVKGALDVKKAGNAIVAQLGGRSIHPVNAKVGGFHRAPRRSELTHLLPELRTALAGAEELLAWIATFDFPSFERRLRARRASSRVRVPDERGAARLDEGARRRRARLRSVIVETQVPWSTALQATLVGRGVYKCGPLARFALNAESARPGGSCGRAARRARRELP